MRKIIITLMFLVTVLSSNVYSQQAKSNEKFGKTLNLGIGLGYYRYAENPMPVFHANFEFDIARNFTLGPFISLYSYRNHYYKGNPHENNGYYYHETVVPVGVKCAYYFDDLLEANNKWDFYAAGSLGFAIVNSHWDNGYDDNKDKYHGAGSLFVAIHIGSEYHFNEKVGAFLDLSSGVSTIGLAFHFN
jgi:hypothetical protein